MLLLGKNQMYREDVIYLGDNEVKRNKEKKKELKVKKPSCKMKEKLDPATILLPNFSSSIMEMPLKRG